MLGKYRLKPSFLLEVAFLVGVWLIAWLVFDAPLAILIAIIFGAYALVFLYETWLDRVSRRERAETRRSRREASDLYGVLTEPVGRSQPRSSFNVAKVSTAEAGAARDARVAPRPATPSEPVKVGEAASVEPPREPLETRETSGPELEKQDTPVALTAAERAPAPTPPSTPGSVSAPEEERKAEPPKPRSLMAEIAAGPEARKAARPIGGWNVWQLERLLAAQSKPGQERDYERSLLLVYLREFADPDGQLPPQFDDLVRDSFGDLARGPASQWS